MQEKYWKTNPELNFKRLLEQIRGMTAAQKAVALFLLAHGKKGVTLSKMQEEMELGRSTIDRAMPGLRRAGVVIEATK